MSAARIWLFEILDRSNIFKEPTYHINSTLPSIFLQMRHPILQRSESKDDSTQTYEELDESETSLDGGDLAAEAQHHSAGGSGGMAKHKSPLRSRLTSNSHTLSTQHLITDDKD